MMGRTILLSNRTQEKQDSTHFLQGMLKAAFGIVSLENFLVPLKCSALAFVFLNPF
jgi:hypothetical protein